MLLYIVTGSYMVLEQAGRYASHKWQWWFDSYQSMIFLALFFMMLIDIMSSFRNGISTVKENTALTQYAYVRNIFCFNIILVSVVSAVLFPALYLRGFHWYYLCIIYLFCVGFHNIFTIPLILSKKIKNSLMTNVERNIVLRKVITFVIACCPYVLILGLSLFDESLSYLIVFTGISVFTILGYNYFVQMLIKCWNKYVS